MRYVVILEEPEIAERIERHLEYLFGPDCICIVSNRDSAEKLLTETEPDLFIGGYGMAITYGQACKLNIPTVFVHNGNRPDQPPMMQRPNGTGYWIAGLLEKAHKKPLDAKELVSAIASAWPARTWERRDPSRIHA